MTCSPFPLPFEIGQIGFLVQKDAQYSETYKKTILGFLPFLFFGMWLILCSKFLENLPQYRYKRPKLFAMYQGSYLTSLGHALFSYYNFSRLISSLFFVKVI